MLKRKYIDFKQQLKKIIMKFNYLNGKILDKILIITY